MSEREKLIEILNNAPKSGIEKIADYILENGVVVFPVKNHDIVWFFDRFKLKQGEVTCMKYCKDRIDDSTNFDSFFTFEVAYQKGKYDPRIKLEFSNSDIDYSVFLSEERAKKADALNEYTNVWYRY